MEQLLQSLFIGKMMKVSDQPSPHAHLCAMLATEALTCITRLTGLYSDYWRGYIHGLFWDQSLFVRGGLSVHAPFSWLYPVSDWISDIVTCLFQRLSIKQHQFELPIWTECLGESNAFHQFQGPTWTGFWEGIEWVPMGKQCLPLCRLSTTLVSYQQPVSG